MNNPPGGCCRACCRPRRNRANNAVFRPVVAFSGVGLYIRPPKHKRGRQRRFFPERVLASVRRRYTLILSAGPDHIQGAALVVGSGVPIGCTPFACARVMTETTPFVLSRVCALDVNNCQRPPNS